ncbi:PREDICTED: uncharacterized protein LOC105359947 [Ceratosolen solmsi marchali]|uniref:Uncharacterized protein LOC105359947 n=1 Tax=Ceratosolen solmsi marchali TaxID=326594 RepID=A0AAJ6VKQ9_9HYME|nr:PREDICTED: uncharacterized protein LOC105359947 [Ceratosolen solmsi marchali]
MDIEMKIYAPITWGIKPKFKIQDFRENRHEEILLLIKHHYFREEAMCRSSKLLDDAVSLHEYLNIIRMWMNDTTSLVAVSVKSGRIIGTVITRINRNFDKTNTYSRMQILEGRTLQSIWNLKSALILQANAYEAIGHDTYLRVYILSVHPSYKEEGVAEALLLATARLAIQMKISAIGGIFTTEEHQLSAYRVGFSLNSEIFYDKWMENNNVVFKNPGKNNVSAKFMSMLTPNREALEKDEVKENN